MYAMYVCLYIRLHVCVRVCTYVCMNVCMYVCYVIRSIYIWPVNLAKQVYYVCMWLCISPDIVVVVVVLGQDHVRWSAVTAYEILNNNKEPFIKLVGAFEAG